MTALDPTAIEFGLDTFGDIPRKEDGALFTHAEAIRATLEEAKLADAIGVDAFTVGEHHRPDYAISSPPTMLAGIATATQRLKLASGVTVLSSDDPVRVFEQFATFDALSNGRAEVILGRGSFTESFPLFGYNLEDYNQLFEEKLGLWAEVVKEEPVTWSGQTRAALNNADLYPKTEHGLTTGSASAVRRSPSCAPPSTGSASCSRSSAAHPSGSSRTWTCTSRPRRSSEPPRTPWVCTPPALSPTATRKPRNSSLRSTQLPRTASEGRAGGRR